VAATKDGPRAQVPRRRLPSCHPPTPFPLPGAVKRPIGPNLCIKRRARYQVGRQTAPPWAVIRAPDRPWGKGALPLGADRPFGDLALIMLLPRFRRQHQPWPSGPGPPLIDDGPGSKAPRTLPEARPLSPAEVNVDLRPPGDLVQVTGLLPQARLGDVPRAGAGPGAGRPGRSTAFS